MFSIPPATTTSASPAAMAWAASMAAFRPEPHILLIVVAGTETGSPAYSTACRAGACPRPALSTLPTIASSTWSFWTSARRSASAMAMLPRRGAGIDARPPRKWPIGVRAALRMTTVRMLRSVYCGLHIGATTRQHASQSGMVQRNIHPVIARWGETGQPSEPAPELWLWSDSVTGPVPRVVRSHPCEVEQGGGLRTLDKGDQ